MLGGLHGIVVGLGELFTGLTSYMQVFFILEVRFPCMHFGLRFWEWNFGILGLQLLHVIMGRAPRRFLCTGHRACFS